MKIEKSKTTEISPINGNLVSSLKNFLNNFQPQNDSEAIRMLHFLSTASNESIIKSVKDRCYEVLNNNGMDRANAIDMELDLEVVSVVRNTKVYNTNEKIEQLEAEIKELQERLKAEKEAAGVSHHIQTRFWKIS